MQIEQIHTHPDFVALSAIDGIAIDLRYQGDNNFLGRSVYGQWNCAWLHREAAEGIQRAAQWLTAQSSPLQLQILDALRPHRAQQLLWDQLQGTQLQMYLANPQRGSIHSFGMAVDVTLLDANGNPLDMGAEFDQMSPLSHPEYEQQHLAQGLLTHAQLANRHILYAAMRQGGFKGIKTEWWHFDHGDVARIRQCYERID